MRLLVANASKFYRLSRSDKRLLATAGFLLPVIKVGLQWLGYRKVKVILGRIPGQAAKGSLAEMIAQAQVAAWAVRVAASYAPFRSNCLPQSLALWYLLRRRGIGGDLRFGVDSKDGQLEAHAWVEFKGLVLSDSEDVSQRFAPFPLTVPPF